MEFQTDQQPLVHGAFATIGRMSTMSSLTTTRAVHDTIDSQVKSLDIALKSIELQVK